MISKYNHYVVIEARWGICGNNIFGRRGVEEMEKNQTIHFEIILGNNAPRY